MRSQEIHTLIFFHTHTHTYKTHLHELHEVLEELLLVDAELALVVYDPVVLHLALAADAERVVAGVVGALTHQVQPRLRRVQQSLRLLPRDLPVEPSGSSGEREREREGALAAALRQGEGVSQ